MDTTKLKRNLSKCKQLVKAGKGTCSEEEIPDAGKSSLIWGTNSSLTMLQSLWVSRHAPPGQYDRNESDQVLGERLASLFLLAPGYVCHVQNLPSSDDEMQKYLRKRVHTPGEK